LADLSTVKLFTSEEGEGRGGGGGEGCLFVYVRLVTCLGISKSWLDTLLSGKTVYILGFDLRE